jgi:hypothetical protein
MTLLLGSSLSTVRLRTLECFAAKAFSFLTSSTKTPQVKAHHTLCTLVFMASFFCSFLRFLWGSQRKFALLLY